MQKLMNRASVVALIVLALAPVTFAQEKKSQEPPPASLLEQAQFAEEQERDFDKALGLYRKVFAATAGLAQEDKEARTLFGRASEGVRRLESRLAGIAQAATDAENSPMNCRLAERMFNLTHFGPDTEEVADSYRDIALLGAMAVPWLRKAIDGPIKFCNYEIVSDPPIYIRALAEMSAPEGSAALEQLLSSPDPIARRAVAQYSDPERHRAILLRAMKDPADAVRSNAIAKLSESTDLKLLDVMLSSAREGNAWAMNWLAIQRSDELLRIAATASLPASSRSKALKALAGSPPFRPTSETMDTLLSLARPPAENEVRSAAMGLITRGVSKNWTPLSPELTSRIESAIVADPAAYLSASRMEVLMSVGGAASLSVMIDHSRPEDQGLVQNAIAKVISRAGPEDFASVASAYSRVPIPIRGTSTSATTYVHEVLRGWLESMAANAVPTAVIANGAKSLDAVHRRNYLESVVKAWLRANLDSEAAVARAPKLDPGFVELLRELSNISDSDRFILRGLGASRDPKVLPDLIAMIRSNAIDSDVTSAIGRILANDPQRIRTSLQILLPIEVLTPQSFANYFPALVSNYEPAELLSVVKSLWSVANAARLMTLVAAHVPGPEGSQFLMAHYGELDADAASTRSRVIESLGEELYEPAIDLLGSALRDPNPHVRSTASKVFERFKTERQRVTEFEEWRKGEAQSKQTIDELLPMLDSSNSDVVVGAVKALASLKARSCYPKLVLLLEKHKNDEAVKAAVKQAIDDLGK